jgi:hypothetical protein
MKILQQKTEKRIARKRREEGRISVATALHNTCKSLAINIRPS